METEVWQDHAFVYVGWGDWFVGVLEIFIKQTLLNLESDL